MTEVSISGSTATTTARHERKVTKHSRITAPYQQQHAAPGVAHHDVGGGFDAGRAGGQQELRVLGVVGGGEGFDEAVTRASVSALWSRR
jgi:hypothetical protein